MGKVSNGWGNIYKKSLGLEDKETEKPKSVIDKLLDSVGLKKKNNK